MNKIAPVVFHALQVGFGSMPCIALFNLTQAIPGYCADSTISRQTIERLGYIIPDSEAKREQAAREKLAAVLSRRAFGNY